MWPLFSDRWLGFRVSLGLPPTPQLHTGRELMPAPVLLYGIPEQIMPKPLSWPERVSMCGFWAYRTSQVSLRIIECTVQMIIFELCDKFCRQQIRPNVDLRIASPGCSSSLAIALGLRPLAYLSCWRRTWCWLCGDCHLLLPVSWMRSLSSLQQNSAQRLIQGHCALGTFNTVCTPGSVLKQDQWQLCDCLWSLYCI